MNRPSKRPRTETGAEIYERRRKEAREAETSTDRIVDAIANPDALYAQRRTRAGHSELQDALTVAASKGGTPERSSEGRCGSGTANLF